MAAKEPTVEPRQVALAAFAGIAFADESSKSAAVWLVAKAIARATEKAWDEGYANGFDHARHQSGNPQNPYRKGDENGR